MRDQNEACNTQAPHPMTHEGRDQNSKDRILKHVTQLCSRATEQAALMESLQTLHEMLPTTMTWKQEKAINRLLDYLPFPPAQK